MNQQQAQDDLIIKLAEVGPLDLPSAASQVQTERHVCSIILARLGGIAMASEICVKGASCVF